MNLPIATYRMQFNEHFRLPDALALAPYLHDLGISHVYASPLFAARPHSAHGYDVCDFSRINPELGTEADLEKLVAALRELRMGLVLDLVPNHMGIGTQDNAWWWNVLKDGPASSFADHFDIAWQDSEPAQRGKILLPVLGGSYESLLAHGEFHIERENGGYILRYHEQEFPLAPGTMPRGLGLAQANANRAALDEVIQRQHYRLLPFDEAGAGPNYRRFFAINHLAGVRVEDAQVFDHIHALVQNWLARNWLDGLRVDHPDGLREPENYLWRLRLLAPEQWIVIEKILTTGEKLPAAWPVDGTTGYDFLNCLNELFVDPDGEKPLSNFYAEFTGESLDYGALVRQKKLLALTRLFPGELTRMTELLLEIAQKEGRDFPRAELREALMEFAASLPVYRTYASAENKSISQEDRAVIASAVKAARARLPGRPRELFDFLAGLMDPTSTSGPTHEFIARFQQLTGPVMAKGVEDMGYYCYNRFVSLNEVGGDPAQFGGGAHAFHEFCRRQQLRWPYSMLATSTHDTKRSEDVRARLNLLSEIPNEWIENVRQWSAITARHRRGEWPDRNLEYLLYQTLAGAWPITTDRVLACMEKSAREAGQHTTWTAPNEDYEKAVAAFIEGSLGDAEFTRRLDALVGRLADAASVNSLAQTLLKLTAPGVPDIYQGCEIMDFSVVDPDNRRPVNFDIRQQVLAASTSLPAEQVWKRRGEGMAKIWLIHKTLRLRARHPEMFVGDYEPLYAIGGKAGHVVAFMRGGGVITVVPRLALGVQAWGDTALELPRGHWRNEFTGEHCSGSVQIKDLFEKFPVALLVGKGAR